MTPVEVRSETALGAGAEFDAIRAMAGRWGSRAVGLGDDASLLEVPRGDLLVSSVDSAIEGRHFRRDWLSPREVGCRAVCAALSDLAAMAAMPLGILVSLGVPSAWRESLLDVADGIGDALALTDTVVLGGNLSNAGELSITTTVVGHAFTPLRRSGAKPGNEVYVTGELGGAAAALQAFTSGARPLEQHRRRFVAPVPRIREARWLADRGATAAIDTSDGLVADLGHLAAASQVRIELDVSAVPCAVGVEVRGAAVSGEEYEIVVCAPAGLDGEEFRTRFGVRLTCVGRVVAGRDVATLVDGKPVVLPRGYDHFLT